MKLVFIGSLHHAQYCEKLQKIVDFVGSKISLEELTTIWKMQNGKHITVIDNIHSIISSAVQSFSPQQMEHFLELLEKVLLLILFFGLSYFTRFQLMLLFPTK